MGCMDADALLYKQWQDEKEAKILAPLPANFYEIMLAAIEAKIAGAEKRATEMNARGAQLAREEVTRLVEEAVEADLRKIGEIYSLRRQKNMEALQSEARDVENRTDAEKRAYDAIGDVLTEYERMTIGTIAAAVKSGYERILKRVGK